MNVLENIAPFLFHGKRKTENAAATLQKKVVRHPTSVVRTKKSSKQIKKPAAKQKRTAKLPAVTLTASKKAAPGITTSAAAPISTQKPKGRFVLQAEEPKEDAKAVASELLAEAKEDSFLSKVALKNTAVAETKKTSGWTLLKSRFMRDTSATPIVKKVETPELDEKAMAEDSFLKRVQKKDTNAVVGTAIDETEGSLEELTSSSSKPQTAEKEEKGKGRILYAADLRKEAKEAKEAALRVEQEMKEIKAEMKTEKPEAEEKKAAPVKEVDDTPVAVHVGKQIGAKKKNGLQQFLAGIGYIGLGKERLQFIQNLATMLNAGLPLVDAIKTLQAETKPKPMKKLLQRIVDMVDNGSPLWRAMEAQSFFSPHAIALVRIGEEAGNLAGNMAYLAAQDEKDHDLKSKVKMAMIYPSIVLTIMAVVVVVLGMFVLPNLIGVLTSLNVKLPLTTRIVIQVSNAFTEYGYIGIPSCIGGIFLIIILNKYTGLKVVFQWITFRIPGVGRLAREATIARFGVILGGLLKAGVPVTEAMQSMVEVTTIVTYRKFYIRMLDHITVGDSFAKSFSAIKGSGKLLPPSVQQLVITGEKSGALADIMLKISDIYDKKASETAQKLPIILEPMLLLFIGGLVGTIAFSILVPIYSIVGNVGR